MAQAAIQELVTFKEIAISLGISRNTLWKKTKHLKPYLKNEGDRKRHYTPEEVAFLIKNMK